MKRIDPQKLLQPTSNTKQASFSAKFLVPARNVQSKSYAKVEESSTPEQQDLNNKTSVIKLKFIEVTRLFSTKTQLEKNKTRQKRIQEEKDRRAQREEEKESSKTTFRFGSILPKLSLPRTGFLDTIKRFLLYSLLGFAVDSFVPLIPKLLEFGKKVVPAIQFLTGFAGALAKNIVDYIDIGYKTFDTVKDYIKSIIPPDISKKFGEFSSSLNIALNGVLFVAASTIAALPTLIGGGNRRSRIQKSAGSVGGIGIVSLLNKKVRKSLLKRIFRRRQLSVDKRGRARDILSSRRAELRKQSRKNTTKQNLAENVRNLQTSQQRRTGFAPGLGGAIDLDQRQRKRIKSIQITGRDGSVERYRLNSNGKVIDFKKRKFKDFRRTTGDVSAGFQRSFDISDASKTEGYKEFNISQRQREVVFPRGRKITRESLERPQRRIPRGIESATRSGNAAIKASGFFNRSGKRFLGPLVSALIDVGISIASGDNLDKALITASGAGLGSFVGGILGSFLPVAGNAIGGIVGSVIGASLAEYLYDTFVKKKTDFEKDKLYENMFSTSKTYPLRGEPGFKDPNYPNYGSPPNLQPGTIYTIQNLVALATSVGFRGNNAAIAAAIAMAESAGDPTTDTVKSGTDPGMKNEFSIGLWQINMRGRIGEDRRKKFNIENNDLYDPNVNAKIAFKISSGVTFGAWTTYTSGKYKKFLPAAQQALSALTKPQVSIVPQSSLPPLPPTNTTGQKYGADRPGGRKHAGVDFDAKLNDTFYSRIGGKVMRILKEPGGYGNYVDIYNEKLNVTERIAEGDVNLVKVGQVIKPGTPVQKGTSQTGVFHYEIRRGSSETYGYNGTLDPLKFLNSLPKKKASISKPKTATITQGLNDQADYEGDGYQVVLMPIVKTLTQPVPISNGGGTVVNSDTSFPLTFTPALVG